MNEMWAQRRVRDVQDLQLDKRSLIINVIYPTNLQWIVTLKGACYCV
jgi:hypothetical protein